MASSDEFDQGRGYDILHPVNGIRGGIHISDDIRVPRDGRMNTEESFKSPPMFIQDLLQVCSLLEVVACKPTMDLKAGNQDQRILQGRGPVQNPDSA